MALRRFDTDHVSRRALLRGTAMASAGAASLSLPFATSAVRATQGAAWPEVTSTVERYVRERKVANMLAVMGWGQAEPQLIGGGDLAFGSETPAGLDSLYRIYSMTKPVTGMAAMMLIDDGQMGLDQPLAEILPAYSKPMVQVEYDGAITPDNLEPAERPITIRHLLTHTAGLGYGIIQQGPITGAYTEQGLVPGQISRLPIPGLGSARAVEGLATFADRLAELPLVLQPGKKWSYSVSLDLLGRVIEVVSGTSFEAFLNDNLFKPAGMDSTYFTVPQSEIGRFTTNYGILEGLPLPMDPGASSIYLDKPPFAFGGAGLVSSPRDYDRWLRMLLGYGKIDGKRVMGELAVRVGTSDLLPKGAATEGTWVAGQGFGAGGRSTQSGSSRAFGWGGAAGTVGFVDFGSGLRAGLYTQYMPSDAYDIQNGFPDIVARDLIAMNSGQ